MSRTATIGTAPNHLKTNNFRSCKTRQFPVIFWDGLATLGWNLIPSCHIPSNMVGFPQKRNLPEFSHPRPTPPPQKKNLPSRSLCVLVWGNSGQALSVLVFFLGIGSVLFSSDPAEPRTAHQKVAMTVGAVSVPLGMPGSGENSCGFWYFFFGCGCVEETQRWIWLGFDGLGF